ncbi:GNAT family N-acetyltransferase [Methylobacterium sp.]|uniref:GNAT family N-acetyltransferase n=1 Tax=Methylobacterium sp. TaxID=409 RepID=UPI003B5AD74D
MGLRANDGIPRGPYRDAPTNARVPTALDRVWRRLGEGPYGRRVSIGLGRDVTVPFATPEARFPVLLRDCRPDDLAALFPRGCDATAERERADVLWRFGKVESGEQPSRCFVAVDARTDRPCHIQWLTEAGCGARIRRAAGFPGLEADEAMLENAYTPVGCRGLGVMTAAVGLIADLAASLGKRRVVAFIDEDNVPSLRGAERAGLSRWSVRTRTRYGFGVVRISRFRRLPPIPGRREPGHPEGGFH